jgi:flagellar M-ring protein FliF
VQNLISIWSALDLRKKAIVLGATVAMFLAVLGLARMAGSPQMVLLYAGLEAGTAGEIVTALDQRGVAYEVRGDSIFVDANDRDSLRMALAAEGLPSAGGGGYELLDSLTGFGTTSQMFDAAYWRAKEGELARTILAVPEVKTARVHISQAPGSPLRRAERPTASVTVSTSSGTLDESQARALKHLVASAVAGMRPEDVQIIDTVGGLIAGGDEDPDAGIAASTAPKRFAATCSACSRRAWAPARRWSRSRWTPSPSASRSPSGGSTRRNASPSRPRPRERSDSATKPGGDVTVASNLPEGDAAGGGNGKSQSSETRERVNYEVSETQRELCAGPGGIRRMTVAVLIDGEWCPPRTAPRPGRRAATRNWRRCANWSPRPSAWTRRAAMC